MGDGSATTAQKENQNNAATTAGNSFNTANVENRDMSRVSYFIWNMLGWLNYPLTWPERRVHKYQYYNRPAKKKRR